MPRGEQLELDESMTPTVQQTDIHGKSKRRLAISFFLFGLVNNVLYVVILSAALDLVPSSTPTGVVAFCNIAPALAAKIGWPYLSKGTVQYAKRIVGCCLLSFVGMLVIAAFDSTFMRLVGISLASFSSGLGELTFLQLSTRYRPPSLMGYCVGYFASGTGAAGLVGAGLWWILRRIGVRTGIVICSILPFALPFAFYLILPYTPAIGSHVSPARQGYQSIPVEEDIDDEPLPLPLNPTALSFADKRRLMIPLITTYILPLFFVYLLEYTINQGISPTLLYPVPSPQTEPFLSLLIKNLKDYYPLWQLVYQAFVFLSRSSISIGLPPIPKELLSVPAIVQAGVLTVLVFESGFEILGPNGVYIVVLFIALEGICGGLAYVNAYYYIGQESVPMPPDTPHAEEWGKQAQEFQIGALGFADSAGILVASLVAIPLEGYLCRLQLRNGRELCKSY